MVLQLSEGEPPASAGGRRPSGECALADDDLVFAFGKAPLLSRRTIVGVVLLVVFSGLSGWTAHPAQQALKVSLIASAVMVPLYIAIRLRMERVRRRAPGIVLGADALNLPAAAGVGGARRIPLADIRSIGVSGPRWYASLLVDTRRRLYAYEAGSFADPEVATHLRQAVMARLASLPEGADLAAAIECRHRLADDMASIVPWGTRCMVALICLCFLWQTAELRHRDVLGLVDIGAASAPLIWAGEWYRLVAANLLHGSPQHLLQNAVSLLFAGAILERLVGWRASLILLLSTCLVAQLVSALISPLTGSHLYSVGISGGIFGLLGALGVIALRFGATLPGGARLTGWRWSVLVLANAVLIPWLVPRVDWAAHAGGAVAGAVFGALLCHGIGNAGDLRRPRAWSGEALAGLAAVWVLGGVLTLWNAHDPAARMADRRLMVEDLLLQAKPSAALRNLLAWTVAEDPASGGVLIQRARMLGRQAVVQQSKVDRKSRAYAADIDTLAALAYRAGDTRAAAMMLSNLPWRTAPMGTHLAQFLDQAVRDNGTIMLDGASPPSAAPPSVAPPSVTLGQGVMRMTVNSAMGHGGRLYAIVRHGADIEGVMFLRVPPGFSGTQVLPLPPSETSPGMVAPDGFWTDGQTSISPALFDRRDCSCKDNAAIGPYFAPYLAAAALPPV